MLKNSLSEILKKKKITQKQLAEKLITDPSYICNVVSGRVIPRIDTAFNIAQIVGVPPFKIWYQDKKEGKEQCK